jgi:hypothetical protein
VHTDDVGMPKCRSEIGFPGEASTETPRRSTTREAAISVRHAGVVADAALDTPHPCRQTRARE